MATTDRPTEAQLRDPLWPLGYCPMSGHSQRGCATWEQHLGLVREGVGISRVPGPTTERELREEIAADHALVRDEFHGRLPDGWPDLDGWAPGEVTEAFGS